MQNTRRRGMSIRANLSWVLAGTLVCGLCITGYFSWSLINLERMQYEVSSHSLALRELDSVGEQLDLLLVSSDLAIGSGETYTAQIASSLASELAQQISNLRQDSTLPHDQKILGRFSEQVNVLAQQIKAHESAAPGGHDADRSELLAQFDTTSGEVVEIFNYVSATAQTYADQKSAALAAHRADSTGQYAVALGLYFMANALLVFWTIRRIAWPLEELSRGVSQAINKGSGFAAITRGPLEIIRLAKYFARLVTQLEQKVAERTRNLLDKTSSLEQEVVERKATQAALESAIECAEKASRVKSEFLSVMSHELRTPMNAVLGSLGLIRDSGISAEQQEYVDIADESGKALVELLGEILDLSKIEAEEFEFKRDPFSVYEVMAPVMNMLKSRASEKGLRLSALIDPDVPAQLVGDLYRVRQILINLVNNAIKFTTEGFVDVRISVESDDGSPRDGSPGMVRFSVTDSGIGVDQSARSEIFDSFTQVDSSFTRAHSGVGLGLSICSKLAKAMGGSCGVESTPGIGSTFWVTLALPAQEEATEGSDGIFCMPPNPAPVLVIKNDDKFADAWLSTVLQMYDVPFCVVAGSKEAKAEWTAGTKKDHPYGCLIVPIQNSEPSAIRTLEQLASRVHDFGGRIVALTSEKESVIIKLVKEGQIDGEHYGTVCQSHLLETVLGSEYKIKPNAGSFHKPVKADLLQNTKTRILIVEDSQANRLIAAAILQNSGFEVEAAGSGPEAISKFQETAFDLVFMDLQMPGMDGLTTTRAIRRLPPPRSNTPIIALTANVMEETRNDCITAGMNDFISKPFVKETVIDRINHWTTDAQRVRKQA